MYPGAYAQNERWIVCICGKMVMLNKPRASTRRSGRARKRANFDEFMYYDD